MKRLDGIIADVKAARGGANHPWIYDDSGNIASGVICADVIPLLEALKDYELDVTDEQVDDLLAEATDSDNTYNWGANISNDLNIDFCKNVEINGDYYDNVMVIMVHLRGDIRGGYSDYFVVPLKWEDLYEDFDDVVYQSVDINDRYTADVNMFSEEYTVYDYETGEDIGQFYEVEVADLLKAIEDKEND